MASISFIYRSTKNVANLTVRVTFRLKSAVPKDGYKDVYAATMKKGVHISQETMDRNKERFIKDVVLLAPTEIQTEKSFFAKDFKSKAKDSDKKRKQTDLQAQMDDLEIYLSGKLESCNMDLINTEWLKSTVSRFYSPKEKEEKLPTDLISFMDVYLESRTYEIDLYNKTVKETNRKERNADTLRKKLNTIKSKIQRFQRAKNTVVLLSDVNEKFKREFYEFCINDNYSYDTIKKDLGFIRSVCYMAEKKGMEVSADIQNVKIESLRRDIEDVYLSFEQLNILKELELPESLEKYRDWLLVACYTGQRISDFLRFSSDMLNNGALQFTQQKTNKKIAIQLHEEVKNVLAKRNGDFPPKVSDQKFNLYVKEVCRLAGFTEKVYGRKKTKMGENSTRNQYGYYEFWELVTGHTGRRSFATNYYGKMPTSFIRIVTGHSSEKQLLEYLKKADTDLSKDIAKYY